MKCAELTGAEVVVVEGIDLSEVLQCALPVAHAVVAVGEHVLAVDEVHLVEVAFPDEQVGQRDGEEVHRDVVEDVLLAVVDELVEQRAGLVLLTELAIAESGIEKLP